MNGVNPLVHGNQGGYGELASNGRTDSARSRHGGVSIDSAAMVARLFLERANDNWESSLNDAEQSTQQSPQGNGGQGVQGGTDGKGGAPDNIAMAKLSQAQQNLNAVNTMADSMIQNAGQNAKEGAKL